MDALTEITRWWQSQGAPADQNALIGLLKEVQTHLGGSLSSRAVTTLAQQLSCKESLLLALIRRIPSLKMTEGHLLQMCAGVNCGKSKALREKAQAMCASCKDVQLELVGCMRLCGKGPNLKWDGTLYHRADEALLKKLLNPER